MSLFAVTVETIAEVGRHPNADRLDLASLRRFPDWRFVVARGQFTVGDRVIYFPIDSLLPSAVVGALGLMGKLSGAAKNRVKTVTLRGAISQGLCARPETVLPPGRVGTIAEGDDLTAELGVIKYEPPVVPCQNGRLVPLPDGVRHYDIEGSERFQHVVDLLLDAPVVITEKVEGSHAAFQRRADGSLVVCQRNHRIVPDEAGGEHDWFRAMRLAKVDQTLAALASRFPGADLLLRGEVLGPGVQGNLYRLKELSVRAFELEVGGVPVDAERFLELMDGQPTSIVPVLARGQTLREFLAGRSVAQASTGPSRLSPDQAKPLLREGIVIKPAREQQHPELGRVVLKKRSPEYLAGNEW
jgi:RNA ligase (TIGR02306 family)